MQQQFAELPRRSLEWRLGIWVRGYDGAVVHGRKGLEAVAVTSVMGVIESDALGVRAVQADDAAFRLDACSLSDDRAVFIVGRIGELVEGVRRPRGKRGRVRVRGRRKHSLVESVRRDAVGDYLSVEVMPWPYNE